MVTGKTDLPCFAAPALSSALIRGVDVDMARAQANLMQVEVKSTQRAQLQLPTNFDSSSNHTRPRKQPAQILCRIHIHCHRLLKTTPLLWLLRCPHLYFHLSCRNQASYTATPPPAPSRLASPTKRTASLALLPFFTHCYLRWVKPAPTICDCTSVFKLPQPFNAPARLRSLGIKYNNPTTSSHQPLPRLLTFSTVTLAAAKIPSVASLQPCLNPSYDIPWTTF
jgi:hypothetical protein